MKTRKPFRLHRCRHESAGDIFGKHPRSCKVGIDPATVDQRLTPEQQQALGYSLPRGYPCTLGQRAGLSCAGYEPWTPEEIAADEERTVALIRAAAANRCLCGADLTRVGTMFRCSSPTCTTPVSGFFCGRDDIRG